MRAENNKLSYKLTQDKVIGMLYTVQLMGLQTCLYSALEEHLGSREVKFKNELRECHRESQQNMHDLHSVRGQLETVLTLLLAFLEQQRQHAES